MTAARQLRGLCAIADTALVHTDRFADTVSALLRGGARVVQYRDKTREPERRAEQAATLVGLCREYGALSIINDDVELALASGADGVHVGRDDSDPAAVRDLMGGDRLLGVSCYDDLGRALDAVVLGADYVSFGSVFHSTTKPEAVHVPLTLFRRARREMEVPLCAIGGITADNASQVFTAGADLVAVAQGLLAADDIAAETARIAACAPGN